mmetsp:Transcript_592/g.1205  ORF Transcript_592/g.1205 Transcript_592/m.1205 type:complete len:300 (+) Transcript_592:48-947(+)|eukprot:CAMPEP_0119069886 /NCGR_PEP_ID=MMETSP1178-20130426/31950_1 /TAXON_ID=33656 /ORGANISM="unid sp, Strain CCMP2000" /LENGTH=299 /DNA_ID=CAMNT_0007051687 /DNA_START=48 /DNA_END=947 /DNA_ORIENTATION=+
MTLVRRAPFRFSDSDDEQALALAAPYVPLLCKEAKEPPLDAKAVLEALRCRAMQPFDENDSRHLLRLETLWHCAFPGSSHPLPFERRSEQWKELGFQSTDPTSDLRGGGHLALEHLLKFVMSLRGAAFDPSFPLAIASINCTAMLTRLFGLHPTLVLSFPGGSAAPECSTATLHSLLALHCQGTDALQAIHAELLACLMRTWVALGDERPVRTMMDFPVALGRAFRQLCTAVARAPSGPHWLHGVFEGLQRDQSPADALHGIDCCVYPGAVIAVLLMLLRTFGKARPVERPHLYPELVG